MKISALTAAILAAAAALCPPAALAGERADFLSDMKPMFFVYGPSDGSPFIRPQGVFFDKKRGQVLVADGGNHRVSNFDKNGRHLFTFTHWVADGAGGKRLGEPRSVAVNSRGDIILTDALSLYVHTLNFRGETVETRDLSHLVGEEITPTFLAIDDKDRLYVADSTGNRVLKFDSRWNLLGEIGSNGRKEGQFQQITGLWADEKDNLFVTDMGALHCVQKFNAEGQFEMGFGRHKEGTDGFSIPSGVATSRDGSIWVADAVRQTVAKYNSEGRIEGWFGGMGAGLGALSFPVAIATDGEKRVYVVEKSGNRFQLFETGDMVLGTKP